MQVQNKFSFWKTLLFLSLWSWGFVFPILLKEGLNICTLTFSEGSIRFWAGENPYASPVKGDLFHYSPFFALLYGFLPMLLHNKLHALVFAFLNSFIFWWGILSWINPKKNLEINSLPQKNIWFWIALIACATELDISLRYQQTNAMITGFTLLALSSYKNQQYIKAGFFFSLAVNFKIFPILIAAPFLIDRKWQYIISLFSFSLLFVFLPWLAIGPSLGYSFQIEQIKAILNDLPARELLDISSVLKRAHFSFLITPMKYILIFSSFLSISILWFFKKQGKNGFPWELTYGLMISALLLLNPRTESPTFVFIAPGYIFLMLYFIQNKNLLGKILCLVSFILISFCYTSLWPTRLWPELTQIWVSKTWGCLLYWGVSLGAVLLFIKQQKETKTVPSPVTNQNFSLRESNS